MEAIITYRPNAQKTSGLYDKILSEEILNDICLRVTGQANFRVVRDSSAYYNKGRLVIVQYAGIKNYVSLSETEVEGRNSSLQSVPTAINLFYADEEKDKKIYYYFMPHTGNAFTDYHKFIYKLMITAGVQFLNLTEYYSPIKPYRDVNELILDRDETRKSKSSNNSSYVSKTPESIQIYGKVYGASKYESTLMALAVSAVTNAHIELFSICENGLKKLPQASIKTIEKIPNISIYNTALTFDRKRFLEQPEKTTLRSPIYQYNLHARFGHKHCALCNCDVQEIIQGAHIWNLSDILKSNLCDDEKYKHAICGHNGLWLCQNHHKLLDANIIVLSTQGDIMLRKNIGSLDTSYIAEITKRCSLSSDVMSDEFIGYLKRRTQAINMSSYEKLAI